jgi:hypothetical protein
MNISIGKTTALVVSLAKLHNFCLDRRELNAGDNLASDKLDLQLQGAVSLQSVAGVTLVPAMLGGGHHWDNVPPQERCRHESTSLPRSFMHEIIVNKNLSRPIPENRQRGT